MKRLIISLLAIFILIPIIGSAQVTYIVYAVGDNNTILELVSGQWRPVDPGIVIDCGTLLDIWGSSSEDIYVTGCGEELLHFNGIEWQKITIPDATPFYSDVFYTVDGTGPDNIYVAGQEYFGADRVGVAYHYDGYDWNYVDGYGSIHRLWADPGGGFYSINMLVDFSQLGDPSYYIVAHYKDGQWTQDRIPYYEYLYDDQYYDIAGSIAGHPFMSGKASNPFTATGGFISRRDTNWNDIWYGIGCGEFYPDACPVWPVYFYGIWCESDTDVWFAGENGIVMHWTPAGYTEYDTGVTETLLAIWGSSNSDVYAVGDFGRIVHFDGSVWATMPTPTTQNLKDIWGLFELPVATLIQTFSTDAEVSRITIRWLLSELDESVEFRVSRMADASDVFVIDDDPDIEGDGLSFTYVDTDVEPGGDYTYFVEYSSVNGWLTLLETGRVTVPSASLALMPNYPNPFNPSTRITYSVPEHGHVSLLVYDVSGRLVSTIVNKIQTPGTYSVHWNGINDQGKNTTSGTYFCRLVTAKRAVTRKILLMR